jgi:hypothetical protein
MGQAAKSHLGKAFYKFIHHFNQHVFKGVVNDNISSISGVRLRISG